MAENIVIDASVPVSALIGKEGPSQKVFRQRLLGRHKPLISKALFSGYEDAATREKTVELRPLKPQ